MLNRGIIAATVVVLASLFFSLAFRTPEPKPLSVNINFVPAQAGQPGCLQFRVADAMGFQTIVFTDKWFDGTLDLVEATTKTNEKRQLTAFHETVLGDRIISWGDFETLFKQARTQVAKPK